MPPVQISRRQRRLKPWVVPAAVLVLLAAGVCIERVSAAAHHARHEKLSQELQAAPETFTPPSPPPQRPLAQPKHGLVTIEFDDAYESVYHAALPILQQYDIVATVNAIADRVTGSDPSYMHRNELLYLQALGWEIASHSMYHVRPLTKMTDAEADYELRESAQMLRSLGLTIDSFVTPYDAYNAQVRKLAMAYYQDVGAGGETSNSYPPADCYSLTRVGVYHRMSVDHFRKLIADAEEKNSWLILFFHMISDESRPLAYPPAQFRELMEYIHTQPVEVVTQWEGVQLARAAGQPPPPASNKPRQAQATPAGSARKSAAPTVPVKKPRPPAKPISPPQTSGEKPRP